MIIWWLQAFSVRIQDDFDRDLFIYGDYYNFKLNNKSEIYEFK